MRWGEQQHACLNKGIKTSLEQEVIFLVFFNKRVTKRLPLSRFLCLKQSPHRFVSFNCACAFKERSFGTLYCIMCMHCITCLNHFHIYRTLCTLNVTFNTRFDEILVHVYYYYIYRDFQIHVTTQWATWVVLENGSRYR